MMPDLFSQNCAEVRLLHRHEPCSACHCLLQGVVQQWLGKYQDTAVEYAQQGYDQIQEYVRTNLNDYVEANNLTQVVPCILPGTSPSTTPLPPSPPPSSAKLSIEKAGQRA